MFFWLPTEYVACRPLLLLYHDGKVLQRFPDTFLVEKTQILDNTIFLLNYEAQMRQLDVTPVVPPFAGT